jgi:osmotically-inducible protein OsmY
MVAKEPEPIDACSWDIKRRITNLLFQRGRSSLAQLAIEVDNGTVTVRGTVRSFYERQVCLSCCQHVPGVFRLVDEIKVQWPLDSTNMAPVGP